MKRWMKIACVLGALAVMGAVYARSEPDEMMLYRYTVQPGDTVWGVCSKVASDKDDIRQVVWQTMHDSHIEHGDALQPGQELVIRVKAVR